MEGGMKLGGCAACGSTLWQDIKGVPATCDPCQEKAAAKGKK